MRHPGARADLLLHSLTELQEVWLPVLEVAEASSVTEVGSETGANSLLLAEWTRARGGRLVVVDPGPAADVREAAARGELTLVDQPSPDGLADAEPTQAYLLDGDHNYATLHRELDTIYAAGRTPVAVLHDVGWPWARRDLYYDPARLGADERHEYSYHLGVRPDVCRAGKGGFRGAGEFAVAVEEGGPRNGVRTAVEDFLAGRPELAFRVVPSVFGLGLVFPRAAPWAQAVEELLAPYADNAMLDRLESNRIELYLRVLELQDELVHAHRAWAAGLPERDRREAQHTIIELELRQQVAELDGRLQAAERASPHSAATHQQVGTGAAARRLVYRARRLLPVR